MTTGDENLLKTAHEVVDVAQTIVQAADLVMALDGHSAQALVIEEAWARVPKREVGGLDCCREAFETRRHLARAKRCAVATFEKLKELMGCLLCEYEDLGVLLAMEESCQEPPAAGGETEFTPR